MSPSGGTEEAAHGANTRRNLIGGAVLAGASLTLSRPLVDAVAGTPAECEPEPVGSPVGRIAISPRGTTVWTANLRGRSITAHRVRDLSRRHTIEVGGAPVDIAIDRDGLRAVVATAAWDSPGLSLVDLRSRRVRQIDAGPDPRAVVFSRGGRSALVAGGGQEGTLTRIGLSSGRVGAPLPIGGNPRDLALTPDGRRVLVPLNSDSALAEVDLATRKVRRIPTAPFPAQVAISPDGRRAFVTHDGFGMRTVTAIDLVKRRPLRSLTVGPDPGGVAFSRGGTVAAIASTAGGQIFVLDARTGRRRRKVSVPGSPRAIAIAGSRAVIADAESGALRAVRIGARR